VGFFEIKYIDLEYIDILFQSLRKRVRSSFDHVVEFGMKRVIGGWDEVLMVLNEDNFLLPFVDKFYCRSEYDNAVSLTMNFHELYYLIC